METINKYEITKEEIMDKISQSDVMELLDEVTETIKFIKNKKSGKNFKKVVDIRM